MSQIVVNVNKFDLSELGLIWWGGPIAFILTRKNIVKMKKIRPMREFFINEFGLFEVDSETQYRYGKQPMSFYNSHGTSIPKNIVKKVEKLYQAGKFMEIRHELEQIYPEIIDRKFTSIYHLFGTIVEQSEHQAIDIDTEKFLPYYRAYNPISIKRLNEVCQTGRKAIDSLHPSLKPPMPIMIAVIGGILGLAFIQNAPKYVREATAYFEDLMGSNEPPPPPPPPPPPEPVAEPTVNATANFILYIPDLIWGIIPFL